MAEENKIPDITGLSNPTEMGISGGVVNPLALKPIDLNLPSPPPAYPTGVRPSNLSYDLSKAQSNRIDALARTANDWAKNPYHYSKAQAFNADYDGANIQHYMAVPRVYKKHGWSPFRDNEALYNKEATWKEYFDRSVSASFNLAGTAFSSMVPWNAWDGNTNDIESAKEMERQHAIGHDSRGGFGSWVNNMTVDAGYTFGILSEFAAEELVGWLGSTLIAPFTGGSSWAAMGVRTGQQVKKIADKLENLTSLGKMADRVKDSYDWVKNTEHMKNFYNMAKSTPAALGKGALWTAKELAPGTAKYGIDLFKSRKAGDLTFDLAKASKGFGAFYRDMRSYAAIMSESKLEGGSTELNLRETLIDEHYAKHGKMPDQAELSKIYASAADAGRETFWYNLPALYISNKIVFDKALKGFKPLRSLGDDLKVGIKEKLVWESTKKEWAAISDTYLAKGKRLFKASTYTPKNLYKNVIGGFAKYSLANITEGIQEMYQDAVSNTMKEYYKDRFYHPSDVGSKSAWGYFADNAAKSLTSSEGWSAFGSGFFMGGLVQAPQKFAFEYIPTQFSRVTDKEGYRQYKKNQEENKNKIVNALNAATKEKGFWDKITENAVQQMNGAVEAERALDANDKKTFYDIVDDDVANHIEVLLASGKIDVFKDQIADFKKLDAQALQEAFGPIEKEEGDAADVYRKRMDSMLHKISLIEKHYNNIQEKYANPFNPSNINKKKNPEVYAKEYQGYTAFEQAKKAAWRSSYHYERAVERMNGLLQEAKKDIPVAEAAALDYNLILDPATIDTEIQNLNNEIKIYSEGDEVSKAKAKDLEERKNLLEDYQMKANALQIAKEHQYDELAGTNQEEREAAKKEIKIQKGTLVRNKRGKEHVVSYIKRGIPYNEKGERIGNLEELEIISGEVDAVEGEELTPLEYHTEKFKEAYNNWLTYISKQKDGILLQENVDRTFTRVLDFYALRGDARVMADAVNNLHDPQRLLVYASRMAQVIEEMSKQHEAKINEAYTVFQERMRENELLQALWKLGVFMDEEGMDLLLKDKKFPASNFYHVASKDQVLPGEKKYDEIIELFDKFDETNPVTEKPILEEEGETAYATKGRNKIQGDKRTLKEHASYWGFNESLTTPTKVKTQDVLFKIIQSDFSTAREKMLARKLLSLISKESSITFQKLATPGEFRSSEGAIVGTFVDPRYSSHDYIGGKELPIESVILHEIIHELTSIELQKNQEFKNDITKLWNAAKEAYKTNPPRDPSLYRGATKKEFYGLKNIDEFVAEMFSNDRFATWLKTIPYENTGVSTWDKFLEVLGNFFKRILGVGQGGTLYDEALYIATSHIDNIHGLKEPVSAEAKIKAEAEVVQKGQLTPGSSIEQFRSAGILGKLLDAYRDFYRQQEEMTPGTWPDSMVLEKDDNTLANTPEFKTFLQLNTSKVQAILNEYNKAKAPSKGASIPLTITSRVRQELYDLGYSKIDVDRMKPEDAQRIITEGKTKPKAAPVSTDAKAEVLKAPVDASIPLGKLNNLQKLKLLGFYNVFLSAQTYQELIDAIDKGFPLIFTGSVGIRPDRINKNELLTPEEISDIYSRIVAKIKEASLSDYMVKDYIRSLNLIRSQIGKIGKNAKLSESIEDFINGKTDTTLILEDRKKIDPIEAMVIDKYITLKLLGKNDLASKYLDVFSSFARKKIAVAILTVRGTEVTEDTANKFYSNLTDEEKSIIEEVDNIINQLTNKELAALEGKGAAPISQQGSARERGINTEIQNHLKEVLGYKQADIEKMSYEEAKEIYDTGLTKADKLAAEQAEKEAESQLVEYAKERLLQNKLNQIAEAEYLADLMGIVNEAELSDLSIEAIDILTAAIEERKRELARDIKFEDIKVGDVIKLKTGYPAYVLEKTEDKIIYRNVGDIGGKTYYIRASEIKDKVLYKDQPGMEPKDLVTPISSEAQEVAKENIAASQELNNQELLAELEATARNASEAEVNDEFDDSLGCKQ